MIRGPWGLVNRLTIRVIPYPVFGYLPLNPKPFLNIKLGTPTKRVGFGPKVTSRGRRMISALWVRMTELNPEYRGLITRIGLWGISCYNLPKL